ncbi:MAG: hypothetical protein E6J03_07505 [Chloroflexi bacterium]|nr:MAG: hypothetical protein E6J03_07505 [Chloroflexota bacterium]
MYARVVRVRGSAEGAEERTATFQREALPVIREQPGFAGVVTLGDPGSGVGAVVTYWESEEAMTASAEVLAALRERMTAGQGLEVLSTEQYEINMLERRAAPVPGNAVRVTRANGNLDTAETALAQLRGEGLALASTLPGFRALRPLRCGPGSPRSRVRPTSRSTSSRSPSPRSPQGSVPDQQGAPAVHAAGAPSRSCVPVESGENR